MERLKLFLKVSKQYSAIEIELISGNTVFQLTELSVQLWPECDFEQEFSQWMKVSMNEDSYCALARSNEHYIGFIHIAIRTDYVEGSVDDKIAYIEGIFVKPGYRNQGVATLLLASGEQWAKSKGLKQIASDTEIDNINSQQFHKQAGFDEVNRVVCFLKNI